MSEAEPKRYRSAEEGQMRDLIVPELRRRWPGARVIHELPLRYSTRRIDLAAVTPDKVVAVEIKSTKDVADRLEAQIRGFAPICSKIIVALAPKHNEKLLSIKVPTRLGTEHRPQYTLAQQAVRRSDCHHREVWTCDAEQGRIEKTDGYGQDNDIPWTGAMLDMLHVQELVIIGEHHRLITPMRRAMPHRSLVRILLGKLNGDEIVAGACWALRARAAFDKASDPPINEPMPRPRVLGSAPSQETLQIRA